ncbi:MAG: M48 family metallopeptidase [Bacteroidota bacterium]
MSGTAEGIHFDGKSAVPRIARLVIQEDHDVLVLHDEGGTPRFIPLSDLETENTSGVFRLRFGENPEESLEIRDESFRAELLQTLRRKGHQGIYSRLVHGGAGLHLLIALLLIGGIAFAYWFVVPWVAERTVSLLPERYDSAMGSTFYDSFVVDEEIDSVKTQALRSFAAQLKLPASERQPKFTVVVSKEENAFALPDGNIVVYSGILKLLDRPEQLVALIGHENAHVTQRHSMKLLSRSLAGYLFISVALSDVNGVMAVLADNANALRNLSYSRTYESEADRIGLETLMANDIAASGMRELFEKLEAHHDLSIPGFLSTHPVGNERIAEVRAWETEHPYTASGKNAGLDSLFNVLKQGR